MNPKHSHPILMSVSELVMKKTCWERKRFLLKQAPININIYYSFYVSPEQKKTIIIIIRMSNYLLNIFHICILSDIKYRSRMIVYNEKLPGAWICFVSTVVAIHFGRCDDAWGSSNNKTLAEFDLALCLTPLSSSI